MVVMDTCAMIELAKTECRLSRATLKKIQEGAYILSISFAEIACLVRLNRLKLSTSLEDFYKAHVQIPHFEIIKIGVEEWFDYVHLDWQTHKDPADRLITAFAIKRELPIVTTDKQMKKFYKHVIW